MRELMLASQPDAVFPLEVRTVAADDAYLSPQYGTPTLVLSRLRPARHRLLATTCAASTALLGRVRRARALGQAPLPDRATSSTRATRRPDAFIAIRRELDPAGVFLNDHLRPLFR